MTTVIISKQSKFFFLSLTHFYRPLSFQPSELTPSILRVASSSTKLAPRPLSGPSWGVLSFQNSGVGLVRCLRLFRERVCLSSSSLDFAADVMKLSL